MSSVSGDKVNPIPPTSFYGCGTFSTLQEAADAVIELDFPSTENVQLVEIPSSPDPETDCDEDDLLNDNVQDIPGTVEVEATDIGDSDIQEVQVGLKKIASKWSKRAPKYSWGTQARVAKLKTEFEEKMPSKIIQEHKWEEDDMKNAVTAVRTI
ncbi:hypothetical protein FQA39_LY13716 [Lamprigera yunnana]|nr:hypothetical protein FQA39_LY13716 [Lamprigera yunnana]